MKSRMLLGALAPLMLAACGLSLPGSIDKTAKVDPAPAEPAPERALSSYLHDLSPADETITLDNAVLEHYALPTSSGTLDSWIRRPPGAIEKQPLILVITPYYGGGNPESAPYIVGNALVIAEGGEPNFQPRDPSRTLAKYFLPRGYAVGLLSIPGTGNSGGCYKGGGPRERKALAEAIEALAKQPWSNGSVGSIGASADGSTSTEMYAEGTPALKAVVPEEALTDYYRYSFNNGIRRGINSADPTYYYALTGLNISGLEGGIGPVDPSGFIREVAGEVCTDEPIYQAWSVYSVITADKTAYWHERDGIEVINADLSKPRPAIFFIEGFQDANVDSQNMDGWMEAVQKANAPWHLWVGQWVHNYAQPPDLSPCEALAPCRGDFWQEALLAWFDQFLKGKDTGILDAPPIQLQADDGVWRHEDQWPPAGVQELALHPSADGALGAEAAAVGVTASYKDDLISYEGIVPSFPPIAGTALDFVSAPLEKPLRLTGLARLETVATADRPIANLVATLMVRRPDGQQGYVNFAALNLNHWASLDNGVLNITGQTLPVNVKFFPQDNVIPAGSQLVLHIAGAVPLEDIVEGDTSNMQNMGPNLMPISLGGNVVLDLSQTRLVLPVNPGDRVEPLPWLETQADPAPAS